MKDLHKEDLNIPVGLLIGANCPLALEPHEIIHNQDGGPYVLDLVWVGVFQGQI